MDTIDSANFSLGPPLTPIVPRRTSEADPRVALETRELNPLVGPIRALLRDSPIDVALVKITHGVLQVLRSTYTTAFFRGRADEAFTLPGTPFVARDNQTTANASWNTALQQVASEALEQGRFASGVVRCGEASLLAMATPILVRRSVVGAFGLVGDVNDSRNLAQAINLVVHEVAQWCERSTSSTHPTTPNHLTSNLPATITVSPSRNPQPKSIGVDDTISSSDATASPQQSPSVPHNNDLLTQLIAEPDLASASRMLAERISEEFGFDNVFIGCATKSGNSRLLAISSVPKFSSKSPLTLAAEETLSEALICNQTAWGDMQTGGEKATSGSRELARICHASIVFSGPIGVPNTRPWGAWVAVRSSAGASSLDEMLAAIDRQIQPIAHCLQLFDRAQGGRLSNAYRRCRDNVKTKKGALSVALVAAASMLVPMPYHVKCDCEIQPVTRRIIPVPYDGVLQEVFVEPGDDVKKDQVLARMEGQEIQWELVAAEADYVQAAKQHDGDLAVRDAAAAQVARLEMDRLKVRIDLLNERLSNLEIKSPIDGVIIGGDPKKKEGARLAQGDSLFEAGPLSNMVAEILVSDDEISRVAVDQDASLRLDAYPLRKWHGKISRVSPSAEIRAQKNVFVAEFDIDNPQHVLRPGMRGRSRIATGIRPLGWNLFHKAWEQLVYGWGW